MKHLRTADPDLEEGEDTPYPARGAGHLWNGTEKSLERAIRSAPIPKYDPSYAQTFADPLAVVRVPKGRHATATLHLKVQRHLAPESLYPRCDWCGTRGSLLIYGRWAFHRHCWMKAQREAPETTKLKPFTAYTTRRPYATESR